MGVFQEKDLTIRVQILEETEKGVILEIAFKGIHNHNWPYGSRIDSFVKHQVRKIRPAALVFDFMEYRYDFGNEIAGPILAAVCGHPAPPPCAIIAEGITARSLKSLFGPSKLDTVFKYKFFEAVGAGCDFLRRVLSQVDSPPGLKG